MMGCMMDGLSLKFPCRRTRRSCTIGKSLYYIHQCLVPRRGLKAIEFSGRHITIQYAYNTLLLDINHCNKYFRVKFTYDNN